MTLPRVGTGPVPAVGEDAALRRQAQDFTGVALDSLLAPIFATTDSTGGLFGGGEAEAAWRPMLVTELARSMAAQGGLGLTEAVYAALLQLKGKP